MVNATNRIERTLKIGAVELRLVLDEKGALCAVELPREVPPELDAPTLKRIISELSKYEVSLDHASDFTRRVWERMRKIPAGATLTYSDLAVAVGQPRASRAVGGAVGANRLLIALPCHRVVGKSGLGGFREGLEWKRKLLELESAV